MKRIIEESKNGILKNVVNIKAVFSDNKNAPGLKIADEHGVKTFYSKQYYRNREKGERNIVLFLKSLDVKLVILAGYMRILSSYFVNEFKDRIINIHPADNDIYKGVNGYLWAFENKLSRSYITIHLVNEYVDSGRVLNKEKFLIPLDSSFGDIKNIGLKLEHEIYSKTIRNYVLEECLC